MPQAPQYTNVSNRVSEMRPTWAEISLPALRHNFTAIQDHVAPNVTVCAVVKADAYGHGAVPCARALEADGATWFAVSSVDEGIVLRQGGIRGRILLLSGFWRGDEECVIANRLTPAIWEWWQVELLEDAAARMGIPSWDGVPVHLKVNTGMNRLGAELGELPSFLKSLASTKHISLEGLFTHLASAEVLDAPSVDCQLLHFEHAVAMVRSQGFSPVYLHVANSSAIVTHTSSWKDMVRPGISLYGYYLPFTSGASTEPDTSLGLSVEPVLSWKTRIMSLRHVDAGQPLGYNGAYVTTAPAIIAALPVGYADGMSRHMSSRGRVIVRDGYASIVGKVSMDLTLIDVTRIPGVSVGDEVTLIGSTEHCSITAWEHAHHCGTIPYEVLCNISKRVPRKYVE
jgi:alanine racemase